MCKSELLVGERGGGQTHRQTKTHTQTHKHINTMTRHGVGAGPSERKI